ncbi:hypothetical protein D3C73_1121940 [compost metagenome]
MKAVPKVNIDGLYLEDELVDDAFSGVVPFYAPEPVLPLDTNNTDDPEQPEEREPEPAGYIVGVPVPQGLFRPQFDLMAWEAREEGDTSDKSSYWGEGLTPEEIKELTKTQEPTELELLKAELTNTQIAITDVYEQFLLVQKELTS